MFGINGTEMIILIVVALLVIGPSRLPEYAQQLRDLVRSLKRKADEAKAEVQRDLGDDFKDVDWRKLDPRQYDPRRIVREALMEEETAARRGPAGGGTAAGGTAPDATGTPTAGPSAVSAGEAASGAADAGTPLLDPLQRHRTQAQLRDTSAPAPFDLEAT
jgi:sec-independent protein translocase protein TatB